MLKFKIGSATALIGDPSGKTTDRMILNTEEIISNSNKIQRNILKIFQNHENFIWKKTHDTELPKIRYQRNKLSISKMI